MITNARKLSRLKGDTPVLKKVAKAIRFGVWVLFAALAITLTVSSLYQAVESTRTIDNYPPPGEMVDVGGYRLHFNCVGNGNPTVVLESGGGFFSLGWLSVQDAAKNAANVRVCSYDRAGLGWSDENPGTYSITGEVEALRRGLVALGIRSDLILVGHSYGGFIAKLYANRFPEEVVGLVLVDPNTTTFFDRHPQVLSDVQTQSTLLSAAAPLGLVRGLMAEEFRVNIRLQNADDAEKMLALMLTTKHLRSQAAMLSEFTHTVDVMRSLDGTLQIPVIIISRGKPDSNFPWNDPVRESDWRAGHEILAQSTTNSKLIVASESDHMILFDQPDLIVQSIADLVTTIRGSQ